MDVKWCEGERMQRKEFWEFLLWVLKKLGPSVRDLYVFCFR